MENQITFPQYPSHTLDVLYFPKVSSEKLAECKSELIARNKEYDYCFLSTTHLVSTAQLRSALYKTVQNLINGSMKANTINTEILLSLSPVNNINDAIKRFGIDESRDDVIVIKAWHDDSTVDTLRKLLSAEPAPLTDETLFARFDEKKFRKLFKLPDVKDSSQEVYSNCAVAASLLRGL